MFKSKLEKWIFDSLKRVQKGRKKYKFSVEYEKEKLPYIIERNYLPDFIITLHNGRKVYIETKGYFSAADRTKMKAVKDCNPNLDIRFVFVKDNKISKRSNMTYTQWADKYGFPWSMGVVPKSWLR